MVSASLFHCVLSFSFFFPSIVGVLLFIEIPKILRHFFKNHKISNLHVWRHIVEANECVYLFFSLSLPKFVYVTDPPLIPTLLKIVDVVADVVMAGLIVAPVAPAIEYSLILFTACGCGCIWPFPSLFRKLFSASTKGWLNSSCSFVTSCKKFNRINQN